VILVHGLLSDRLSWANVVNELRSREWYGDRFQVWGDQYPTGEPFLGTASKLRQQLEAISEYVDPEATDPALDRVVMIGHSMGGLISKMQIAYSGDSLWNAISELPFEAVTIEPAIRTKLKDAFFFEASSMVSRVIFVGTPHRGSALAQRAVGRLGSILIEEPAEQKKAHRKLLSDNPGVFSGEFSNRVPTSVDLLEPDSPLLQAMDRLPLEPSVKLHSIVGDGRWMFGNGDSDGVVPVSSATHGGATSEKRVPGKHADLTSDPEMIEELLRILRLHWEEACREQDSLN
jgi:pimeloyl-ACP methyl ester carboxylesterase